MSTAVDKIYDDHGPGPHLERASNLQDSNIGMRRLQEQYSKPKYLRGFPSKPGPKFPKLALISPHTEQEWILIQWFFMIQDYKKPNSKPKYLRGFPSKPGLKLGPKLTKNRQNFTDLEQSWNLGHCFVIIECCEKHNSKPKYLRGFPSKPVLKLGQNLSINHKKYIDLVEGWTAFCHDKRLQYVAK